MLARHRIPALLGLLSTLGGPALAEPRFSFDTAAGQLPKSVAPMDYDIRLEPDMAAGVLHGTESIRIRVRQASSTITLNALDTVIDDARLDNAAIASPLADNAHQTSTFTLAAPVSPGEHTLSFRYTAKIGTDPQGLFLQKYRGADGQAGQLLTTQLEATDARRVFPCWDEPAFRARFTLTATIPANWTAVGNMPIAERTVTGERATVRFEPTPAMAAYLVEFTAGDIVAVSDHSGKTALSVWAVRGQEGKSAYALANARQILADYNDYFAYPFPLPKLDALAIPGGFTGAMENWGAITYNDQVLLLGRSSSLGNRQQVFSTQAHEMAHQWFGDLVTMGWWDNLWLNESFASWMAARETDLRNPQWNWWQVQDGSKEQAMHADARASTHPIQQAVSDELQAQNAIDPEITYAKGQAVLRMFEQYLGPAVFRDGVRRYMADRAYGNATSEDLWVALAAASKQDVGALARAWVDQPGFPLVQVSARCDTAGARIVTLHQVRFLSGNAMPATASHWNIPLQLRVGAQGTPRALLLAEQDRSVPAGQCDEALSVNAGATGYFRTAYDAGILAANTRQFAQLPAGDRIALLDDEWALVEKGSEPLAHYLALASAMGTDLNVRAWTQVCEALETIERDERGTPGHAAFLSYAKGVLRPVASALGMDARPDEAPGLQRLRRTVVGNLGAWGEESVVKEMRKRFERFQAQQDSLGPDEQGLVLGVMARTANQTTFDQLHALARQAHDDTELRRYYAALMHVRDPELARQAAQLALSGEIPPQAADLRIQLMVELSEQNPALSWQVFSTHTSELLAPMPMMGPMIIAQYAPEIYWNALDLDELDTWVRARVPAEMTPNVARGMESARNRLEEQKRLVQAADAYVNAIVKP